jgi:putative heme iron utilization protein
VIRVKRPTLADRIKAGAIPLDEALPIARQLAEALEAAHERGIIGDGILAAMATTGDAHSRRSGDAPEPLYDVSVPTPTHAERARTLVSQMTTGTLCTLAQDPEGYPYGSFVTVAFDAGDPVLLMSRLAEHTKNLIKDPRASLLVAEGGSDDPLANGRCTLIGACRQVDPADDGPRTVFLETHPNSAYYADFRDFGFWKLRVESIRYIGGYGRMSWVDEADWRAAEPDPIGPAAAGIIAHMNEDHAEAMVLYCKAFSRATDLTAASMTAVDRWGFEMSAVMPEGPRPVRLAFEQAVATPVEVRAALVELLRHARAKLQ